MAQDLVVDPQGLKQFAADLETHIAALSSARQGLYDAARVKAPQMFGRFDEAAALNQRSAQLLGEAYARLDAVQRMLGNLSKAASGGAALYQASDTDSEHTLAQINSALSTFEKTKQPGGSL